MDQVVKVRQGLSSDGQSSHLASNDNLKFDIACLGLKPKEPVGLLLPGGLPLFRSRRIKQ